MRKTTLTAGLCMLLLASIASAQEPSAFNQQDLSYPNPDNMEDFVATPAPLPELPNKYIGIQIGGGLSNVKFSDSFTIDGLKTSEDMHKTVGSIIGGLFGGYGLNFNHFYAGGEVSLNYNSLSRQTGSTIIPDATIKLTQPVFATLDFIPGFLTQPNGTLIYGRIGVAGAFTQVKFSDNLDSFSDSSNSFNGGLRVGLGIDHYFCDWFSLRADYAYTVFSKVTTTITPPGSGVSFQYGANPTLNQLTIGFNFHW